MTASNGHIKEKRKKKVDKGPKRGGKKNAAD